MSKEALKLAEIIEHFDSNDESLPLELLKEISATLRALAQTQEPVPPPWWPAIENILNEYGLQAIDFVADFKNALAQTQEPVAWLEPEWREKICPEVGYEVTMTDDHPRDLCWIPLYPCLPTGDTTGRWSGKTENVGCLGEQEPVAWMSQDGHRTTTASARRNHLNYETRYSIPLYTHPPQRTWVGLTNNELQPIADEYRILFGGWVEDFARAIEAKLKEKNGL